MIDDNGSSPLDIDSVKKYDVEANYSKIAIDEESKKVYVINQYPPELLILNNDLRLLENLLPHREESY